MDAEARQRVAEALKGHEPGKRTSDGKAKPLVEVTAADLKALAEGAGDNPVAKVLLAGVAKAAPGKKVYVQADDLAGLLGAAPAQPRRREQG